MFGGRFLEPVIFWFGVAMSVHDMGTALEGGSGVCETNLDGFHLASGEMQKLPSRSKLGWSCLLQRRHVSIHLHANFAADRP